ESPPTARRTGPAAPAPSGPPAPAPLPSTCFVLPSLHPPNEWSLRQPRGGSRASAHSSEIAEVRRSSCASPSRWPVPSALGIPAVSAWDSSALSVSPTSYYGPRAARTIDATRDNPDSPHHRQPRAGLGAAGFGARSRDHRRPSLHACHLRSHTRWPPP